jgi:predicted O-linked N-acetylglucosamine transferase (SPINDLY family)
MQTRQSNPQALFSRALELHQAGRINEAENAYREVLKVQPENPGAVFLFGLCHHQRGDHESAITLMDIALDMNPAMPQAHYNRGLALRELGRHDEAVASYEAAIALQPSYPLAWNNRGNTLKELDRLPEALASYDRAIALVPDFAEAHTNRGNVLKELRRFDEALACHDEALRLRPDYAEAHCHRGNALNALKRLDEAIAAYDQAIVLKPDYVDACINRGDALHQLDRKDDALRSFELAIARKPDAAEAYEMRANLFLSVKRHAEAAEDFERVCRLDDKLASRVVWQLLQTRLTLCDWHDIDHWRALIDREETLGWQAASPFAALSILASPVQQLDYNQRYVARWLPADKVPLWQGEIYAHQRLRVGYFSSDLRNHAVAYLTAGLFEQHDRERLEVHAFYFGPANDDPWHLRLKSAFEQFHEVSELSDRELASLIHELEIDILVDLNGHTQGARTDVLAMRPAPVQVNYIGYPGSMGADYIDYIIADPVVIPAEARPHYSEKTVWLPDTFQVNDNRKEIAEVGRSRVELGLPEQGFVFCCFNNSYKITPAEFAIWMRLLQQVAGSVLWLAEADPVATANLRQEATRRGVDASRLIFTERMPLADYLASYRQADLFLDTFGYNAGTTASDALWAGLPVLTCLGETFAQRMAGSLLNAVGLPELVTESPGEYEALALSLATDQTSLAALRERLASQRTSHPLFDTRRFTRHLEAAYLAMQQRVEAGLLPDHLVIAAEPSPA